MSDPKALLDRAETLVEQALEEQELASVADRAEYEATQAQLVACEGDLAYVSSFYPQVNPAAEQKLRAAHVLVDIARCRVELF